MEPQQGIPAPEVFDAPAPPAITAAEGELLVRAALSALRRRLGGEAHGELEPDGSVDGALSQPAGVFVSVYCADSLRGCLGLAAPKDPLWRAVREMAVLAAERDPRFEPLAARDLPEVSVEVSVLGALVELPPGFPSGDRSSALSIVRVGEHGLHVRCRQKTGLLLPQVADRQGWNARQLLEETCRKAGLSADAWREPETVISIFRSIRFSGGALSGGAFSGAANGKAP